MDDDIGVVGRVIDLLRDDPHSLLLVLEFARALLRKRKDERRLKTRRRTPSP